MLDGGQDARFRIDGASGPDAAADGRGPSSEAGLDGMRSSDVRNDSPGLPGSDAAPPLSCSVPTVPAIPVVPGDVFVDAAAPSGGSGTIDHPFKTIQAALAAAGGGPRIHITEGSYQENVGSANDRPGKEYTLYGGYAAGSRFTVRDPTTHPTLVTGASAAAPVIELHNATAVSIDGLQISGGSQGIVVAGWAHDRRIEVRGCTLLNNGSDTNHFDGGAALLEAKTIRFEGNRVENNKGGSHGGAVTIIHPDGEAGADAQVVSNVIRNNTAIGGGIHGAGMWLSSSGRLDENLFDGNVMVSNDHSGPGGGGIILGAGVVVTATRNLIQNNRSETAGGGLFVDEGAYAILENNIIVGNHGGRNSGGVGVDGASNVRGKIKIVNCTIAGNGPNGSGAPAVAGLSVTNSDAEVINTVFWNNGPNDVYVESGSTLHISYSNFVGAAAAPEVTVGAGVQHTDPMFTDAAHGDYSLAIGSPMIDTGTAQGAPSTDYSCRARPQGPAPDQGAFETSPR